MKRSGIGTLCEHNGNRRSFFSLHSTNLKTNYTHNSLPVMTNIYTTSTCRRVLGMGMRSEALVMD
jgi:hypothetical protein